MERETEAPPILELPYSDRQLILVSDDQLVQATEKQARLALHEKQQGFDWKKIAEAALIAGNVAPGSFRNRFGFMQWKDYDEGLWNKLRKGKLLHCSWEL